MTKSMTIGIVGPGSAAKGIHVPGFQLCRDVELAAVCRDETESVDGLGIERVYATYEEMVAAPDIDAVVIATPNHLHEEMAVAAAAVGKHVLCEKPLALNVDGARRMLAAAEAAGVVHMTAFTYQFAPAIRYLRHLVSRGELGSLRTVRAAYLMALSSHVLGWRSSKRSAGSGVLADIGSHLVHLAQYVAGGIASLTAASRRFREDPPSDVEDWIAFLAEFTSGAVGTFEISRVCPGRGAVITEEMFLEFYGVEGSAIFSLQDPWGLCVALGEDARDPARPLRRVEVPSEFLKLLGSPREVHAGDPRWSYRYDQAFQFVESLRSGVSAAPTFADGVRCQAVLDAALQSAETKGWMEVV